MTRWERVLAWLQSELFARVGKNAAALLAAQVGARLLNLVLIGRVTRVLGVDGLGRYLLAMTVQAMALALTDLGLNTYVLREFARAEDEVPHGAWGGVLSLKLLSTVGGLLVLNGIVAPLFFRGSRQQLLLIVSFSLLPGAFNSVAAALIKARRRMEVSGAINLGIVLVYTLAGLLLLEYGFDERALLLAHGLIGAAGSIFFFCVLRAWHISARPARPGRHWKRLLDQSLPFAVTGMVTMLYTRLDLLLLSAWQGDAAAGVYGGVYRLWEALGLIPTSFLDALFPELSHAVHRDGESAYLELLYRRGRRLLWIVVPLVVIPCEIGASLIIGVLYGRTSDMAASVTLFRVFLLAFPLTYLYLMNGHVLYAAARQRRVTVVMIGVTVANAVCNAVVIPFWSYWGAVGVSLASECLLFVMLQREVNRLFRAWQLRSAA